ncbi:MAG: hypothetical protein JNJ47_04820, partial [Alphaproteobacteria bacterium]|nr:hypothetical protein [Alphaproteobacteria bacterium]
DALPEEEISSSEKLSKGKQEEPFEERSSLEDCRHWLKNIMNQTSSLKGGYFALFQKAHSLFEQLKKGVPFIDDILHTTSELALRLVEIRKESTEKTGITAFLSAPKNYEEDLAFFLETPIKHLKGLRFGFVSRLIKGLGGNVDTSHAGSRIHFELNNKKTSIHLHDSLNGELDGGRISSLRQFIIEAGFALKD